MKTIYQMSPEEIEHYIQTYLPIKSLEKNKYGEVFTPPELIHKMLDLFPQSVWSEPNKKWLDPAAGAGFFMILVYQRLMTGLTKWEPNALKRSDHIIRSMLFMVELNKTNCKLCKSIFGSNANIICVDFLSDFSFINADSYSFGCIVGNPPFQDDYGVSKAGKRINGGKNKLYERIFLKAYHLLEKNGFLSFVVPDNMFSGNGVEAYRVLQKNEVPFVSFNPSNQQFFPRIQQTICYFIVCNVNKEEGEIEKETIIESSDTNKIKLVLKDRPVNPIRNWTRYTETLIQKYVSNKRNNVIYNRGQSLESYRGKKYTIVYTPFKKLHTNNIDLAIGFGKKKAILFSMSVNLAFQMDFTGNLGAGPNTIIIPFQTVAEGRRLEQFLKSDEYKTLVLATKTSRQYLKIALIEYLILTKIIESKNIESNIKKQKKTKKKYKSKSSKTRKMHQNK